MFPYLEKQIFLSFAKENQGTNSHWSQIWLSNEMCFSFVRWNWGDIIQGYF